MPEAAGYCAIERMRDGRTLEIRALKPADRTDLLAAVGRVSPQSLYRRFLGAKRHFSEAEVEFYTNVDFVTHVALVAVVDERGEPTVVGVGRYVAVGPATAEFAFAVIDPYQGHGVGSALMRHLVAIARRAGLSELVADVLADNRSMLKVFERAGFPMRTRREGSTVHVRLQLT